MPPLSRVFVAAVRRAALLCLPAALLSCSEAFAQSPRGWVPQPNPTQTNTYDWTGLSCTSHSRYNGYPASSGPAQSYGGYQFYPPTVNNQTTLYSATASGTSTFKWQWLPPDTAAGTPDYAAFPAPPLFVLIDLNFKTGVSVPGSSILGLSASGSVSSGFDSWNPSFDTVPGQAPASDGDLPHRGVLSASADGSLAIYV